MFKLRLCALIAIASLGIVTCDNDTFLDNAETLFNEFPQYFEDAIEEINNETITKWISAGRGQCFRDFLHVINGLRRKQMWAVKVIDSWGKLPSGVLSGNLYEFGDFYQCLKIDEPSHFVPRYCLARLSKTDLVLPPSVVGDAFSVLSGAPQPLIVPTASNVLGLNFGICIPKSCSPKVIDQMLSRIQKIVLRNKAVLTLVPDTCQIKEDLGWNLKTADYVCLGLIGFLAVIMILSTIYDLMQTRQENKEKTQLFIAFSMYTNGQRLLACKKRRSEHTMECLNGMRVFSALWVIYAHAHVMTIMGPVFNFAYVPEWSTKYTTVFLYLAPFSVDTFLFLSGFLVTWSLLKELTKNGKINVIKLYIHRYLRLTPILAVVIFIGITIYKKIGSGPLWHTFITHAINCDDNWWSSLLYIQNYYNVDSICLSHTWYLSVDMQLFVLTPPIVYLLYRYGYFFAPVIAFLVVVTIGWTFWLFLHFGLINQVFNITNDIQRTFNLTYFPTHVRMVPWLFGILFAYFLFKRHGQRENWYNLRIVLHWTVTFLLLGVIAYYSYDIQQMDHEGTPLESGIYTPLTRTGWSIFLCLVIYSCVKGYGGPVNWFLSLTLWQPLSRLSYAIYLIHMPIMLMTTASRTRPVVFSSQDILFKFFGDFMFTTLLCIFASLALESPIGILERIVFSAAKPKESQQQEQLTSISIKRRRNSNDGHEPSAPENS